jgi:hypothetical protein
MFGFALLIVFFAALIVSSFPRKREPSDFEAHRKSESHWVPAFAGMTGTEEVAQP